MKSPCPKVSPQRRFFKTTSDTEEVGALILAKCTDPVGLLCKSRMIWRKLRSQMNPWTLGGRQELVIVLFPMRLSHIYICVHA